MRHKQDKETKALADELAALPVFGTLDRRAVDALAGTGRVVHLPPQWALITESQPADSTYVLLTGESEVRQHGDVIAQLHPGDLVGEAALVQHRTRNATVVTTSEVRALRLGFDDLTALFAQHPSVEQAFRAEWEKRSAGV
ncbi:MAG TPA: cyclic nucleotide-binding domain-containing protein [Mycobacteriales bacterium]|nr:cyclic nucleotide-binding domain-containing protein [Mycobacteriales bacterium]